MDFRLINEKTLPQVAALWDECFEKKDVVGTPSQKRFDRIVAMRRKA